MIRTAAVTAEDVGFPMAAQAARLLRQTEGRKDEEMALITSAPPSELKAQRWLRLNRAGWGIESGLHQRLELAEYLRWRTRKDDPQWQAELGRRLDRSLAGQGHSAEELQQLHDKLSSEGR